MLFLLGQDTNEGGWRPVGALCVVQIQKPSITYSLRMTMPGGFGMLSRVVTTYLGWI